MKHKPYLLLAVLPCLLYSQTRQEYFQEIVQHSNLYEKVQKLDAHLTSRDLFSYAFFACEAKTNLEQLDDIFKHATRMQDRDKNSPGFGNYRWSWRDGLVMDYNAVEFCMESGALIWILHRNTLSDTQRALFKELLDYSVDGCLHHRVSSSYTNIAIMNAQNLILLGETLNRLEVLEEGLKRLRAFTLNTALFGINEYVSPTYSAVDLGCLQVLNHFTTTPEVKKTTDSLLRLFWTNMAANTLPEGFRLAGSHSRDYDYLAGRGGIEAYLYAAGMLPKVEQPPRIPYPMLITDWRPSEDIVKLAFSAPRNVIQSWGTSNNQYSKLWVGKGISLGIAGSCYHNMDIPLAVNFGGDMKMPRAYFIADGRRDPYGKKKINEGAGPHQKTLHLKPFWGGAQDEKDALGIVAYRPSDYSPELNPTLESHIVLPINVDEILVDDKRIEFNEGTPAVIPLNTKNGVFLRQGGTAAAFRVPAALDIAGNPAPIALVWDGNPFRVARITVAHHDFWGNTPAKRSTPSAAFHVRVTDDQAATPEAFAAWRKAFLASHCQADFDAQASLAITVAGENSTLQLETKRPFTVTSKCAPAPVKSALLVNGHNLGKEILGSTPGIKEYWEEIARQEREIQKNIIFIQPDRPTIWEAESGLVIHKMAIGKDEDTSGGKYVWGPGEPGKRGGGPGNVSWLIDVKEAGVYYLWGRVMTPTTEDDSFFIQFSAADSTEPFINLEWHTGSFGNIWTWTSYKAMNPSPIELPRGRLRLSLHIREDGAKIDQVLLTPNPNEAP